MLWVEQNSTPTQTWLLTHLAFLARFTAKDSFDTLRKHAQALVQPCSHI